MNAILLSFFPNLPQSYDETKEVVLPAVGIIKASVLRYVKNNFKTYHKVTSPFFVYRLVVLAGIISGAFSFSSIIYLAIYYVMIPVI